MAIVLAERYNLSKLKEAIREPSMFTDELRRVPHEKLYARRYEDGIDVMAEDWDNLIVLDACRYDVFESHNRIEGDLEEVISRGSTSSEFIKRNFNGRELHDTVYITANPHADSTLDEGVFYRVAKTYGETYPSDNSRYEKRSPEHVYEYAVDEYGNYDDKRTIVHFMQPHTPYYGTYAKALRRTLYEERRIGFREWTHAEDYGDAETMFDALGNAAVEGHISDEQLRRAYVGNFEAVMEYVEALLEHLDGKTVITSDHGELLGEAEELFSPMQYGHGENAYNEGLRRVPWLVIDAEDRPETTAEEPIGEDEVDEDLVTEQLEALGYKE